MATLTVRNVGPIREADFEVKKHTIFIGPQGSGKSTLAKLIAVGGDWEPLFGREKRNKLFDKYILNDFIIDSSFFEFKHNDFMVSLEKKTKKIRYKEKELNIVKDRTDIRLNYEILKSSFSNTEDFDYFRSQYDAFAFGDFPGYSQMVDHIVDLISLYIPSERVLLPQLNKLFLSSRESDTNLSYLLAEFGYKYMRSKDQIKSLNVDFLNINYVSDKDTDYIKKDENFIDLAKSASGYQSVMPLLIVSEEYHQLGKSRIIVEEPELNLYPLAQKGLIYSLVGGLRDNVQYSETEWVITTHSPYVLSSYNTLLLAYKVAQKSEELREEVAKIIPEKCWINPHDFAAYFVDKGTVRSIVNPKTGLIADNELDDVSEILAGEQDELLALNRAVPRD